MYFNRITFAAGSAVALALSMPAPASAQDMVCSVEAETAPKTKKRGLIGLLGAVRKSGLEGLIAGALRGDGNLKSDLKGAAQRAAMTAAEKAASAAACPESVETSSNDAGAASNPATVPAVGGTRTQVATERPKYPNRSMIPADKQAEFVAYEELGEVSCTACEGGRTNQGWFQRMLLDQFGGHRDRIQEAMLAWGPGEGAQWKGTEVNGSITAQGEIMMGGFRCKAYRLRIERGARSAERDTYLCWGRGNQYHASDRWIEVH